MLHLALYWDFLAGIGLMKSQQLEHAVEEGREDCEFGLWLIFGWPPWPMKT